MFLPMFLQFLLATSIVSVTLAQGDPNFQYPNGGASKPCAPFKCKEDDTEPFPVWPLEIVSSGCGPKQFAMQILDNDKNKNDPTEPCCHQKNACFHVCGTTKKYCTDVYFKCMRDKCSSILDSQQKTLCDTHVQVQKIMLDIQDECDTFQDFQKEKCTCVNKNEVEGKRKEFVTKFYEKYNPSGMDKIDSLLAKVDSSSVFATLVTKLVAKYPDTIKIVKDENAKDWAKMAQEAREKKESAGDGEDDDAAYDDDNYDDDTETYVEDLDEDAEGDDVEDLDGAGGEL